MPAKPDDMERLRTMIEPALSTSRIGDRKSTRLNSSHANISYAVFCLNKNAIVTAPNALMSRPFYSPGLKVCVLSVVRHSTGLHSRLVNVSFVLFRLTHDTAAGLLFEL